ncbi:MAG: hypothetical protein PHR39_09120, partial [Actinomycetota bacterium]|nr:hypothetical protein [Actinomycetota bacterium]
MKNFKKIFISTLIISFAVSLMSCKPDVDDTGVNTLKQDIIDSGIKSSEGSDDVVINDPKANQISILKITGQAIDLKVTGDYLYLTNDLGYLYVVDIKDKKNPEVVGKCSGIDAANIVFIEDEYVFVSYSKYDVKSSELKVDYGFKIIDIKDKKNPKVIGDWQKQSIGTDRSVHGMYVKDNHAFLTVVSLKEKKSTSTFQVVDISKKSKPVSEGSFDIDGSANAVWAEDDYAFMDLIVYESAAGDLTKDLKDLKSKSYVIAIDIKNKKNPRITGRCEVATESWGLVVDKDNAYISSNNYDYQAEKYHDSFLQIVSMNDKANPVLLGECKIKGGAWEIDFKNDYLFVSDLEGGFSIIDVKDKTNPKIIDYL